MTCIIYTMIMHWLENEINIKKKGENQISVKGIKFFFQRRLPD